MKKLINRPEDVVKEALAGMEALHPELIRVDHANQIIVREGCSGTWQSRCNLGWWQWS